MTTDDSFRVKVGLAEMLKGGVIMDVVNAEQAKIAEDAGAAAVMAPTGWKVFVEEPESKAFAPLREIGFDPILERGQASVETVALVSDLRVARRRNRLCRLLSLLLPGSHRYFSRRPVSVFLTLFLFFFFLAAAVLNGRLLGTPQLVPVSEWPGLTMVLLAAAGVVWTSSLWSSWRQSHGA